MPLSILILAAGQGTRMRSQLPKVLHHLAGRPLLDHVVDTAYGLDPARVIVVYGHGGDQVRRASAHPDLIWIEQAEQLGTGHAVQQALPAVKDDDVALVLYGDVPLVRPETLRPLIEAAAADRLALLTVDVPDPAGYGRIVRSAGGGITGIIEDRDLTESQRAIGEINTGMLAAPAARLRGWVSRLDNQNAQGEYYLTDIVAMAARDGVCIAAVQPNSENEVMGINDKVQLSAVERQYQREIAERLMREGVTLLDPTRIDVRGDLKVGADVVIDVNAVFIGDVELGDRVQIGPNSVITNTRIGNDAEILANTVIEDAVIGAHCRVGPFARLRPQTELANEVHVGNFVEIKNTTIGAGSKVNHLSYIGDATIGTDVNIGAGTITCNYDGAQKHHTVVEDGAFIGSNTQLVAPVTVGRGATIGAGSTISKDAPAEKLTLSRSPQTTVEHWKRPTKHKE